MTTNSSKSRNKNRVKSGVKPRRKNTRRKNTRHRRDKNSHRRNKNSHRKRKRCVYRKKRLTHRNKHKKTHNKIKINKETNCKSCFVYKGDLKQKGGANAIMVKLTTDTSSSPAAAKNNIKVTLTDADGAVVTRTAIKTGDVLGSSAAVNKKMKDVLTTYCVVLKKFKNKIPQTINYDLKDFIMDEKKNPEYLGPELIGNINKMYGLKLQTPQLTGNEFHKWMMGTLQKQLEKEDRPSSDQLPPAQHPFKPRTPPSADTFKADSFEAKHNIVPIEWRDNSCYFDSVLASFLYYPNEFMYKQLFVTNASFKEDEICFKKLRKLMYELYTTIHGENSTGSEVANKRDTLRRGYRCQSNLIKPVNQWWNQQPLDSMEFLEFSILPFFKEEHYHIIHLQAHKDELPLDPITENTVGHNTQMVIFYMDRNPAGPAGGMITTTKSITTSITINSYKYKLHSIVAANGIHNTALLCDYEDNKMYYNDIGPSLLLLSLSPPAINEYFQTHSQIYIYIKE